MTKYINTMKDLEAATYGNIGGTGNGLLKSAGVVGSINSGFTGSSDTALTLNGTAGNNLTALYNIVYGQKVWSMIKVLMSFAICLENLGSICVAIASLGTTSLNCIGPKPVPGSVAPSL